jgi:hypothetical protein
MIPYPLCMKVGRLPFSIDKVSINPSFVNSVEFALVSEKICLAQ